MKIQVIVRSIVFSVAFFLRKEKASNIYDQSNLKRSDAHVIFWYSKSFVS